MAKVVLFLAIFGAALIYEQEHRPAPLPTQGLAGAQAPHRSPPRIEALPSVAKAPDERWSMDLCRIWAGRDGWLTSARVMDCHTLQLLGWHLSRSAQFKTAEAALEQALISRYGSLGRVREPFLLRSDNGLVFTSRSYATLVRSYPWEDGGIRGAMPFLVVALIAIFVYVTAARKRRG